MAGEFGKRALIVHGSDAARAKPLLVGPRGRENGIFLL